MTAYRVTILHDACTSHDVEAQTEAAAIESAMNEAGVTLCHHCSNKLEVGDPIRAACVENLDSGESNTEADPDYEVVLLRARVAELEALRADAERLDLLDKQRLSIWTHWTNHAIGLPPTFHGFSVNTDETPHATVRAAIDAARQS